jgi:hypothetical protein
MLILHIGTHKTGTSALQTFFSRRRDALADRFGIHYLRAGLGSGKAHHELAWAVRDKHNVPMRVWKEAREEIADCDAPTTVISSEAFWFADPALVKKALGPVEDLQIVLYLRRQDKYLQSLYKQTVTGGRRNDFASWLEGRTTRGDYLGVVRAWAEAFGREAIQIRPYEREGRTIDVVDDFAGVIGIDDPGFLAKKNRATMHNPSPRRELLELLRALNQLDLEFNHDAFFYPLMKRNPAYTRSADLLGAEECAALVAQFAQSNRTLEKEFYDGGLGPLFPPFKASEPPQIWTPESPEYFAMTVDFLDAVVRLGKGEMPLKKMRKLRDKGRRKNQREEERQPAGE